MESPHARAVAHYKWAARYKRKKHLNKARAHLFRGDHYMRASAFGAPQEFHVGKLIVGSSDHGEFEVVGGDHPAREEGVLVSATWQKCGNSESHAVNQLISSEIRHEPPQFTRYSHSEPYRVVRSRHTGGLFALPANDREDHMAIVDRLDKILVSAHSPREAMNADPKLLYIEDWRDSALLIREKKGEPRGFFEAAKPHEAFAYHTFILQSRADNQDAKCYFRYHATDDTGNEANGIGTADRPINIPHAYRDIKGTGMKAGPETSLVFYLTRDRDNDIVYDTNGASGRTMKPFSMVPDHLTYQTKFRARMILGITDGYKETSNIAEKDVTEIMNSIAPRTELARTDGDSRINVDTCTRYMRAAKTLFPGIDLACERWLASDAIRTPEPPGARVGRREQPASAERSGPTPSKTRRRMRRLTTRPCKI